MLEDELAKWSYLSYVRIPCIKANVDLLIGTNATNEDKHFHTFVANRVSTIRDATNVSQWRYVNTKENPADDESRGVKVEDLLNGGRWTGGPKFLSKPEMDWPTYTAEATIACNDPEVKKDVIIIKESSNAPDQVLAYFSDWRRLRIAIAWFLKLRRTLMELKQERGVADL